MINNFSAHQGHLKGKQTLPSHSQEYLLVKNIVTVSMMLHLCFPAMTCAEGPGIFPIIALAPLVQMSTQWKRQIRTQYCYGTVVTSQIPWEDLRNAQGFATHAVTNWEGEFYTAISCRIRRELQSLSHRVLASPAYVFKILWWPQLMTNVIFGAEFDNRLLVDCSKLLINELSSFK